MPFAIWSGLGPPETLGDAVGVLSSLTNLLMLATLLELRAARPTPDSLVGRARQRRRSAQPQMGWVGWAEPVALPPLGLGIGYWAWTASFVCVAAGLWMRARELKPVTPVPIGGSPA